MGIAIRMAILLRLHREETYSLQNPTKELIVEAESARRTIVRGSYTHTLSNQLGLLNPSRHGRRTEEALRRLGADSP
jgi:hypothetical protein